MAARRKSRLGVTYLVLALAIGAFASSAMAFSLSNLFNKPPADPGANPGPMPLELTAHRTGKPRELIKPADISHQTKEEADAKSHGCVASGCHVGIEDMHPQGLSIGCIDCHGGNANAATKEAAHVHPLDPNHWPKGGELPVRSYAMVNVESPEFVRFINPSDLRAARLSCGGNGCHADEVDNVRHSMMATNSMLWGAALYANGSYPEKITHFGEAYTEDGRTARLTVQPPPAAHDILFRGLLPYIDPLPIIDVNQPGTVFRILERGDDRASNRGYGTNGRVDPLFIGLNKTQLLDPNLWFIGTNDHPGDYRNSGCAGCHVIFANDRDPAHSGFWAKYGNMGRSFSADTAIPKDVSAWPIKHQFTTSIPSSQCVICHMHGGTTVVNSYYGTLWYDDETDGEVLYPRKDLKLTEDQKAVRLFSNPSESGVRGKWGDTDVLANITDLNPQLKHIQLADFHGHGWLFRYVYRQNRHGDLLDKRGQMIPDDAADKFQRVVPLVDIHAEKGMMCADCHFEGDSHGDGHLYAEGRAALAIKCQDCHGTFTRRTTFAASGNAATIDGKAINLKTESTTKRTTFGSRFLGSGKSLRQQSTMERAKKWPLVQIADIDDRHSPSFSALASFAHTIQKNGKWGDLNVPEDRLAHPLSEMTCQACHSAWSSGCFGCHLPAKVNMRKPTLHYDGDMTFAWASYNAQTVRPETLMLARDGVVTGNKISPARSASGAAFTLYDANREVVIDQQQFVSSEGFSAQAFTTYVPHTVRATETKQCTDCHISQQNDNNAIMAQLFTLGTNFVNFIGRYAWVAEGKGGLDAVAVTERGEPQAVYGSHLHKVAYPDEYAEHQKRGGILQQAFHHRGECLSIQNRAEYVYTAEGSGGFNVYDSADLDNKGFSQPFFTAPFSPLGQRTYVATKYATSVGLPATMVIDPLRTHRPENLEGSVPREYSYVFVTDKYEGLISVNVETLADGNPANNFLRRAATFNPDGLLNGAVNITIAGNNAYVLCDRGVVVVDVSDPINMRLVAEVGAPSIVKPRAITIQFRYAFVVDSGGLKVIDVTFPDKPRPIDSATLPIADARGLYVARTYAYVAGGSQGLVIVDVERPEHPKIDQTYNAGGKINDLNDVKFAMTNASMFAYLADGKNGLRVVQLNCPEDHGNTGFSPRPNPVLIASYPTNGPALAIAKGLDRDRTVDESGNQLSVYDRLGSRPFTLTEMQRLYLRNGEVYTVTDDPPDSRDAHKTASR